MEALQRLHMSPVGSPFSAMSHHESMLRANVESGAGAGDRKSPMDTRLVMQVGVMNDLHFLKHFFESED